MGLTRGPVSSGNGRLKGEPFAALGLARGASVADAARRAGVGERTLRRRLADPAYRSGVAAMRADLLNQAAGGIATVAAQSGDVLQELLRTGPPSVRLGAARTALDHVVRLKEASEFEERLLKLEEALAARDGGNDQ